MVLPVFHYSSVRVIDWARVYSLLKQKSPGDYNYIKGYKMGYIIEKMLSFRRPIKFQYEGYKKKLDRFQ